MRSCFAFVSAGSSSLHESRFFTLFWSAAERSGAKAQLVEILREFDKPATYEELWERAKDHERFKSKRFMKQMMQHLKKIRVAKTLRVDNKHFGYMLTHRAVDGGPVLAAAAAERTVQTQTAS